MHLFIVGAGHVGLVTAVGMAKLGHRITVADIDHRRIERLAAGSPPIYEPGLEEAIGAHAAAGRLSFQVGNRPPDGVTTSIVTVSTPEGPNGPLSMTNVLAVVRELLGMVGGDHTIVVRSTLPLDGPDALAEVRGSPGRGPALVTNPEFMREGSALADFHRPDRIVVGWLAPSDEPAAHAVVGLYAGIDAPVLVADARSAALIKLASNVFLATKVAFANELARVVEAYGGDIRLVADGIGLDDRIRRAMLTAGPGFGGSCLPEQAIALSRLAGGRSVPTPLVDAVTESNATHQRAIVTRLAQLLDRSPGRGDAGDGTARGRRPLAGCRIAVFGLAFKARTDDVRASPALALVQLLRTAGADVIATDPRAGSRAQAADPDLSVAADVVEAAEGADAILVVTEWPEYATLDWAVLARRMRGDLVYDTRGVVDRSAVTAAGLRHAVLGGRDIARSTAPAAADG
jgi:UDPglucose 6-dehydrogenase